MQLSTLFKYFIAVVIFFSCHGCEFRDEIPPGEYLQQGDCLCGNYCDLCLTSSGKLKLDGKRVMNKYCDYVRMQKDGNFVCYTGDLDDDSGDQWATNTAKSKYKGDSLELNGCCISIGNYEFCAQTTSGNCKYFDELEPGKYIEQGECLCETKCDLCVTSGGRLELGTKRIASGCDYARMQKDGNFVCYKGDLDDDSGDKWATNTAKSRYKGESLWLDDCCISIGSYEYCA